MNKRLDKLHKRKVARAKEQAQSKASQPDVRTPEQLLAAQAASKPAGGFGKGPQTHYAKPTARNNAGAARSAAKADA